MERGEVNQKSFPKMKELRKWMHWTYSSLWVLLVHFSGLLWEAYPVDSLIQGALRVACLRRKCWWWGWGEDNLLRGQINTDRWVVSRLVLCCPNKVLSFCCGLTKPQHMLRDLVLLRRLGFRWAQEVQVVGTWNDPCLILTLSFFLSFMLLYWIWRWYWMLRLEGGFFLRVAF